MKQINQLNDNFILFFVSQWCSKNVSNLEEPQLTEPHIGRFYTGGRIIRPDG